MTTHIDAAQPRLTRLELHGFKSFANRTVFTFERGITAIIGPNGSGKSNISDGVRWVLGEQSHSSLRSKKTEDVIFAGGHGKAPAGMAEVAVTFDNSTGWLPTEYAEVTITRRAFRSGENQYLINGRKVRLKDVAQLTASLGHSHTVVGQGLVDTALSQRPEERRGLFEHAADLTGLRLKAVDAERNLTETESNSARITDLLTELEPRLKTLERAAKQAREWQGVHQRLKSLQTFHYARLLGDVAGRLTVAESGSAREEWAVEERRNEVERNVRLAAELRATLEHARAALEQHAARLQATVDQARRVGYERDLANERHTALTRRREDMADTQAGLDEQVAAVERQLQAVAADLAAVEQEVAAGRETVAAMHRESAAARNARAEIERAVARLGKVIAEQERRAAELGRRKALLDQRLETDAAERERAQRSGGERAERIARLNAEIAAFDVAESESQGEIAAIETAIKDLIEITERAAVGMVRAQNSLAEIERTIGQTSARLDALKRIHESGTGLHGGVREVLQATRGGKLQGVRGTVAELIEVPERYDTAIEVALGGHLQDIVVARWADAEAAIAHLKRGNAGRATFQPLDTVRAFRGSTDIARALALPGVHGIAKVLIAFAGDLDAVVGALIGRTLVVDDLAAARATLPHLPNGWSTVTLAGEIARTGGSVTGGAAVRESGMLGRERELRELPGELKRLETRRAEAAEAVKLARGEQQRHVEERQRLEAERAGLNASRKERQGQRLRLLSWLKEVEAEQAAAERRLATLATTSETVTADIARLTAEQEALAAERQASLQEQRAAEAELTRGVEQAGSAESALSTEQRTLAGLEERLRSERKREAGLRAQRSALDEE
ncbi:MAG: AAA family ATPase, partial [Thermomicrobiales bacterium]|nr:AAA family ATPase [Thermomicrobiales bacterium]